MKRSYLHLLSYFSFCFGLFSLDVCSKWWALAHVLPGEAHSVTSFLNIVLVRNTGVSFGLLKMPPPYGVWFLIALTFSLILFLVFYTIRYVEAKEIWGYLMIISGGLGNLLDRLLYGGVVDFLDFHLSSLHWPTVFNIADVFISFGVILILSRQTWHFLIKYKKLC